MKGEENGGETIRSALSKAAALLKNAGAGSPSLDASLFLAKTLNVSRTRLYAEFERRLDEKEAAFFTSLLIRRCGGECAAYILGRKEFRALDFLVDKSVLVPRADTETLVEAALEKLDGGFPPRARVLDLCTGCGAVAVSLKNERPSLRVWAADICPLALETARANAARLLPKGSVRFFLGDLFEALPGSPAFHLITANPPYIPSGEIKKLPKEVRGEPALALDGGSCGLTVIKAIIKASPRYLLSGGVLLLEADPRQMEAVFALLEKNGFTQARAWDDLQGHRRVIGGICPAPGLRRNG